MRSARTLLGLSLWLCVTSSELQGQSVQDTTKQYGVVFTSRGLSDVQLNRFRGGIGFKYSLSEDRYLRGTVGFQLSSRSEDSKSSNESTDTNLYSLTLAPGIEYHLVKSGRVSPYWGPELVFNWSRQRKESKPGGEIRIDTSVDVSGGAFGGVEWFLKQDWSLAGEYNVRLTYHRTSSRRESDGRTTQETTVTSWNLDTDALGRLILTIYF